MTEAKHSPLPTQDQIAASERAIDGLSAQADIWADEIDLVVIIKKIGAASRSLTDRMPPNIREGFINRQEANIDALARQAYLEGFMRGGDSRKEYDKVALTAATSLHHELVAALEDIAGLKSGSKFAKAQSIASSALQKARQP